MSIQHNIGWHLHKIAQGKESDVAVIEVKSGKKYSFAELENRSNQYGQYLLKKGISAGDRVMLMVKPSADFICLAFSLFKIGAPVILIDPGMGYRNLLRCVAKVKPKVFIGIPKAHLFLKLFRRHFSTITTKICCGGSFGLFGEDIREKATTMPIELPIHEPTRKDLAAIIFTTGSTGPPKGVRYEHDIFATQLQYIRDYYKIDDRDIDQPAFPLFGLFTVALGACAVIPDMDSTKPAEVNPEKFVHSILENGVTYSFGSPALWNVVSNYCLVHNLKLDCLQKVLMAGAPVSGDLLKRMLQILPDTAEVHTPYGATESLPIVSMEAREIVSQTWQKTQEGYGTCVGRSLPGIEIRIIELNDDIVSEINEDDFLGPNTIGEIIVSGAVVTRAYDHDEKATRKAKIHGMGKLWHRMGDSGYLDEKNRLWFCGRTAHRVKCYGGVKYTIPCEAIINNHPDIFRSALVGISGPKNGHQVPVLILEQEKRSKKPKKEILEEIREIASQSELTADIEIFLFHPGFPVDIRHNAKIFREQLSVWAEKRLRT